MQNTLLALAITAGLSLPAHAVTLDSATLNGNLLDTSFSTPSLIALDVSLLNNATLSFSFVLDAEDITAGGDGQCKQGVLHTEAPGIRLLRRTIGSACDRRISPR